MAALVSVSSFSAPGKAQFAGGELGFSWRTFVGPAVLPLRTITSRRRSGRRSGAVWASSSGSTADENIFPDSVSGSGGYESVDRDMMVLRRRIEGMRMKETFAQAPEEWMEWEKTWYNSYRADVNVLVASLQSQLLGMRPGVVLFIVSSFFAVTPVAALLFLSALGTQLYSLHRAVFEFLVPCSAVNPPL